MMYRLVQKNVKKIIGHLIRAIVDTTQYKTRWKYIFTRKFIAPLLVAKRVRISSRIWKEAFVYATYTVHCLQASNFHSRLSLCFYA